MKTKKRNKVLRFFGWLSLVLLAILLLVSIFITFLAFNTSFRQAVISQIVGIVNTQLTAKIEIEDIHLIGFGGIKLDKVKLITGGDTLAAVNSIFADLSLEPLLRNKIQVNKIVLNEPHIKLLRRISDSTWNYNRIAPPSNTPHSDEPTDLTIRVRNLRIKDGLFYMIDSLAEQRPRGEFNPSKMQFHKLDAELNANANLLTNNFTADIKKVRLYDKTSGINLEFFKGKAELTTKGAAIKEAILSVNGATGILEAGLTNYNVFAHQANGAIEKAVFNVRANLENYSNSLAERFAQIPIKIEGLYNIKLLANGTLGEMNIEMFEATFDKSKVSINGKLKHLLHNAYYNVALDGSEVQRSDLLSALPFLSNNSIPQFGFAKLKKMQVEGDTKNIAATMDIETGGGNIDGTAEIGFHNLLQYKIDIAANKINLQKFVPNSDLASKLNGKIKISGSGVDIDGINATFDIGLQQSSFMNYSVSGLELVGRVSSKDSLIIEKLIAQSIGTHADLQSDSTTVEENRSAISLTGYADISNLNFPRYNLDMSLKDINLKSILKNKDMPYNLSASIELNGAGIDLDNMTAKIGAKIGEVSFDDKIMMPFDVNSDISFLKNMPKSLSFRSSFFSAEASGNFTPSELLNSIAEQADFFVDFASKKVSDYFHVINSEASPHADKKKKIALPKADCSLKFELKNFSPVATFIKDIDISTNLVGEISISSDAENSHISIDSLFIRRFFMKHENLDFKLGAMQLAAKLNIALQDSIPELSHIDISASSNRRILINDVSIAKPFIDLQFDNSILKYTASAKINKMIDVLANGSLDISTPLAKLSMDTLSLNYNDFFRWHNPSQIIVLLKENTIKIDNFNLVGSESQQLSISGLIDHDIAQSVSISLSKLRAEDIAKIVNNEQLDSLKGEIENFDVVVNGDLRNPRIDLRGKTSEMFFNGYNIGSLSVDLQNRDGRFSGYANIYSNRRNKKLFDAKINNLPFYIGTDSSRAMFSQTELFDIDVIASDFPLQIVSPFVPNVSKMQGLLESRINLYGTLPDNINYKGKADIKNASFLLDNTNIAYTANASVSISNDLIKIDEAVLKNMQSDLKDGMAEISGFIKLKDYSPDFIDISVKSNKLLVLSDASQKPMPGLYGYFAIGTESRPIRFFGTMQEPNLEGDVIVYNAELKMPEVQNQQMVRTTFTYEVKNKTKVYKLSSQKDTTQHISNAASDNTTNFADLINYDLSIKIKNFSVLFDMGALGEVYAKIGTRDPSIPMRYVKYRNIDAPKIYSGELELKEGSTLKIFRIMETKGMISFPTGAIDNPTLDLEAKYDGNFTDESTTNYYTVYVYVTGTKEKPSIKLSYLLNGNPPIGDPKKIEEDAFILLATGKTKSSLGSSSGSTNLVGEGFNMGISQLASKSLTDLLLGTGVVQSADVKFQGEGLEKAQVNFSGTILGVGNWTVGGNIYDLSNLEVSFEVPIAVSSKALNDIIFQISRSASMSITTQIQETKDFEMKIKLGGSW